MKKLLALLSCISLLFALTSCSNNSKEINTTTSAPTTAVASESADTEIAQLGNPMTEYSSLEELNEAVQGKLKKPGVMGVTDEKFFTIKTSDHTIAEYDFSVNGRECSLRFSADMTDDISGVYGSDGTVFSKSEIGDATAETEDSKLARWFTLEGQYVLCVNGEDLTDDWFKTITDEMKELTASGESEAELKAFYDSIAGEYADKVSQRASATVKSLGDSVKITVSWADSATNANTWTMTAKKYEDGLLSYSDCKYVQTDYSTDEKGKETVVYSNESGFFSPLDNGNLLWNGAKEENCAQCEFEQIK